MNTREEIHQAVVDYQNGTFARLYYEHFVIVARVVTKFAIYCWLKNRKTIKKGS